MKVEQASAAADPKLLADASASERLAALERLIVYAREEAEKLKSDILVFCLDASLKVAREESRTRRDIHRLSRRARGQKIRH